ncbi:hypothetical protein V5E97_23300 [Singulisphaera sp. Ch08]|uniref:Uncharacterized protein n=1 Tax=Singulisphaera sp. Ch08 TaxID=3120278 RepID=A0AAU7C927_9BACT
MTLTMDLAKIESLVDGVDAAVGQAARVVGDLVVKIGGGEHRAFHPAKVLLIEPPLNASLAISQLDSYLGFHSKS